MPNYINFLSSPDPTHCFACGGRLFALTDPALVDFAANLTATLVGVFVGALLAFGSDHYIRSRGEEEERKRITNNLKDEFETNRNKLDPQIQEDPITLYELAGKQRQVLLTRFNTAVLESVINSGKLTLLNPDTQANISDLHQTLSLVNEITDHILHFLTSATELTNDQRLEAMKILDYLASRLEKSHEILLELIPHTIEEMNQS